MKRKPPREVCAVGEWADAGYLVRGELSKGAAVAKLIASDLRDCEGDPITLAEAQGLVYRPGWYRWNVASSGDRDFTHYLEDGRPGQRGSFAAVYLERPY